MTLSPSPDLYDWIPEPPLRQHPLYPGEIAVLRTASGSTVSEWVQGERYVHVSPLPGPWDNSVTPYLTGLMELFSREHVRELYVAGGSQSAKTDFSHNCLGWLAVHDPGPALLVMQDQNTGTDTISDRLIPMFHDTPSLAALKTKNPDDISMRRIRLRNGMVIYLAWANSEGRLASKPIRYLIKSEVDLYPEAAHRKAEARLRAFEGMYKKIEECTTSTDDGRIWTLQNTADVRLDYHVLCPHCGADQVMDPAQIRWADGVMDPALLNRKGSAWYECLECRQRWDEEDRDEAVRRGEWRERRGKVKILYPEKIWAHISPLLSPFVQFNRVAAAYLATLSDPTEANLAYYYNDCCGLPVPRDAEGETVQEKDLYARREEYAPPGADWKVPMQAVVLTADADVQANRIEVEVVGWGEGHQNWGIEYKVFHGKPQQQKVWDDLHEWAQSVTYRHESGVDLKIVRLGIDIGYATDHVSRFVKRSQKYIAHKGSSARGLPLVPRRPSKSRRYKIPFYELGTDTGKEDLHTWLGVDQAGPRYCHFPMSYDFEYFRMLCSEAPQFEKDRKTRRTVKIWAIRRGFTRNEALDIRVGNIAVREILNPNYAKLGELLKPAVPAETPSDVEKPEAAPAAAQADRKQKTSKPARPSRSGGWLNRWRQ